MSELAYPAVKRRLFRQRLRRMLLLIFISAFAACGIVNICTGGVPWSLYVLGGELLAWWLLMGMPLIERGWLDMVTSTLLGASAYLILLDICGGLGGFSVFVSQVLAFSLLIVQGALFFVFFRRGSVNPLPMYLMILAGILFCLAAIAGLWSVKWPTIVVGGLSMALLIMAFVIFRREFLRDICRRFHI